MNEDNEQHETLTPRVQAIIRRPATVTITLTQKQADTLWWLLEGEMCRDKFAARTMKTLSQIGKRVAKACGLHWRW